ncbi:hypothetical protein ABVB41_09750 [Staphylococcus cohnii]|uniref:hypothetical protein n=1 Tax=Staphylococcus cohnii species complex 1661 TaxID=3239422 RepID=UPI0013008097
MVSSLNSIKKVKIQLRDDLKSRVFEIITTVTLIEIVCFGWGKLNVSAYSVV